MQCSVFSGFNKGSERIVTINRFHGNIIEVIHYMMEFVEQRMNHSMIKLDDTRKNIDAYPKRALFEGVINAIAHRDYFLDGTVYDAKILSFCYYQAHKVSEIAEYLGVSDSTYFRKQVLENLLKNQYLIKSKASRAIYYKTNPEMV